MPYSQTGETFIALSPLTNRFYRHSRCGLTLRVVKGRRELMKISSICEASDSQFFVCNPCMNLEMRNENHKNENSQGEPQNRSLALQVLSLKSRFQFSLFRNFQTTVFFHFLHSINYTPAPKFEVQVLGKIKKKRRLEYNKIEFYSFRKLLNA